MGFWVFGWWEFWMLSWYHDGMEPLETLRVYESILHLGSMWISACWSMGCSRQNPNLPSSSLKYVPPKSLELVSMMRHHFHDYIMSYGTADRKMRRFISGPNLVPWALVSRRGRLKAQEKSLYHCSFEGGGEKKNVSGLRKLWEALIWQSTEKCGFQSYNFKDWILPA